MKCFKCGEQYKTGSHFCQHCGARTAEGEFALAISNFASATKDLVHETARIGKSSIERLRPNIDSAIEQVSKTAKDVKIATTPTTHKAFAAATSALQLAAQAAQNAAMELKKVAKSE